MSARAGVVYLVGAGPGDPGLVAVRALELLASADVVLHDRLIGDGILDRARADAELVYVGKSPGQKALEQEEIEALMVDRAAAGRSVVRLKGGDPFVFGRGGEEAETLAAAGIEFEIVPGITAGVAAPAYAGIPVTHRDDASAVAFVTGHEDPAKDETALDWEALARFPGTLVLYMGVRNLPLIAERLAAAGRDPAEPAAAIERGTHPGQRTVTSTLEALPAAVAEAGLRAPAILLFGAVAARRDAIGWLERRPLHGRRVVVTRARAQSSGFAATLRGLGAEVVELPAIRIEPRLETAEVRDAVAALHSYALVCLTSPNGVRLLFEAMAAQGRDARALANATVAAIGPGTARALGERGVIADIVPERFVAEALVAALEPVEVANRPVLVARAAEARDVLPDALAERGGEVDVVALYETVREDPDPAALDAAAGADYVTFTSSSTVRNLLDAVGERFPRTARVVSIGPVTRGRRATRGSRSTSRPSATTSRAWSRRWSPTWRGADAGSEQVAAEDEAALEAPLLDQLEVEAHPVGQRPGAATDDRRGDEHPALVDETGAQRLAGELGAADAELAAGRLDQSPDGVGIELALDPGRAGRRRLQGARVDDLLGAAPDLGVIADLVGLAVELRRRLPVAQRLVHPAAQQVGAHRPLEVVDEPVHLRIRGRPPELPVGVGDVAVERGDRCVAQARDRSRLGPRARSGPLSRKAPRRGLDSAAWLRARSPFSPTTGPRTSSPASAGR